MDAVELFVEADETREEHVTIVVHLSIAKVDHKLLKLLRLLRVYYKDCQRRGRSSSEGERLTPMSCTLHDLKLALWEEAAYQICILPIDVLALFSLDEQRRETKRPFANFVREFSNFI